MLRLAAILKTTPAAQPDRKAGFLKLSTAIKANDKKAIETAITEDKQLVLEVDADKNNVLHLAAQYCVDDKAEILALLIAYLNELKSIQAVCATNAAGQTPLHIVVRYNSWTALDKVIVALDKDINTVARMCDNSGEIPFVSLMKRYQGSVPINNDFLKLSKATYSNPFKYKLTDKISVDDILKQYQGGSEKLIAGLKFACDIVNQVRAVILSSITHPEVHSYPEDVKLEVEEGLQRIRKQDDYNYSELNSQYHRYIDSIKTEKVGNCKEMTLLGLNFMRKNLQRMKGELCLLQGRNNLNHTHCFIVINRVSGSNSADPSTWGENAVICDPWSGNIYPASELSTRLACHFYYKVTINGLWMTNIISLNNPNFHYFRFPDPSATVGEKYDVSTAEKRSTTASLGIFSGIESSPEIQVWSAMHKNKKSYSNRFEELKLSESEKVTYKEDITKLLDSITKKVNDIPVILSQKLFDFNSLSAEQKVLVKPAKHYRDLFDQFVAKVESQRRLVNSLIR